MCRARIPRTHMVCCKQHDMLSMMRADGRVCAMGQEAKKTPVAEATTAQTTNGMSETTISVGQKKPISPHVATVPPNPKETTPETTAAAMPVTYQVVEHDADVRKLIDH